MVKLVAKSPLSDVLPSEQGAHLLDETDLGPVYTVMPFPGQTNTATNALKDAFGLRWPKPGRSAQKAGVSAVWAGRNQAYLIGAEPDATWQSWAAISDQSDAICAVTLSGPAVEEVLARVTPLDIRASVFKRGHVARTLCQHVSVLILRVKSDAFLVIGPRSMARVIAHDLEEAMVSVAARQSEG